MPVRVVVQHGPRDKKVAAVAIDWPGWSRGGKTAGDAIDTLEAYRERYRPIADRAVRAAELDAAGDLEVVEDHVGTGSTDYWGISFAPSSFEHGPMSDESLDRMLGLLEAAWSHFDDVASRASAEMAKGPRGGGRDRDQIIRHVLLWEQADLARKVGVETPVDEGASPEGLRIHREPFLAALREYGSEGRLGRGRNWTIPLLIRHTAFHALDHAWEMEDKDLS